MQRMAARTHQNPFKPWTVGEKVWLSAANLMTHFPSRKLAPKRHGPFEITAVLSPITFKLKLPKSWKVHPVFHASELSSYRETEIHGPNFPEPLPEIVNQEEEYEIDGIKAHKTLRKKFHYLVSWKGYSSAEDRWLPESELKHAATLLKAYKKRLKLSRILSSS